MCLHWAKCLKIITSYTTSSNFSKRIYDLCRLMTHTWRYVNFHKNAHKQGQLQINMTISQLVIFIVMLSPKERGESERESNAPTQRQPDMASAQTQIRSELPDPLTCTTIPTLTIYRTHQHTTPDSSTRMISSRSRSTHRNTGSRSLCSESN